MWYLFSALMPLVGTVLMIVALVQGRNRVAGLCFVTSLIFSVAYWVLFLTLADATLQFADALPSP